MNGNVQETTREEVVEGDSFGVLTVDCHDYEIRDLYVHHSLPKQLMLGAGTTADQVSSSSG